MKISFRTKSIVAMTAMAFIGGCDHLPEAFSGKPAPNTKSIQAAGPTNSDETHSDAATAEASIDLAQMNSDPNFKMIDADYSPSDQIKARLVNQTTADETAVPELAAPLVSESAIDSAVEPSSPSAEMQLAQPQDSGNSALPSIGSIAPSDRRDGIIVVEFANLKFVNDIEISAPGDGTITKLTLQEGDWVKQGDIVVELDSRLAKAELEVAIQELAAAEQKSNDRSEIQYSKAAQEVAKHDLDNSTRLVRDGVESQGDYRKKWLEHRRAELAITVAEIKNSQDLSAVNVNKAKKNAAELQIDIRNIEAPFQGMVAEKVKDQDDWVKSGDVMLRLVSLDKLRVVGHIRVDSLEAPPHLLVGAPATVDIQLYPGAVQTVEGNVGFVSPVVQSSGAYKFWIEIPNQKIDDQWIFREGMTATVRINARR